MWIYIVFGAALLLLAIYLFMIFPTPAKKSVRARFAGRAYAHRGLHSNRAGPPENSLSAFRAAAENGYGIELDVQLTLDKELVVFHDLDLKRACGVDSRVRDMTYAELSGLRLFGSAEGIPTFAEVLEAVDGRVPLIVELKSDMDRMFANECCRITYSMLKGYKGDYCIESFDPFIVRWFAVYAPKIVRGQLAMGARGYGKVLSGPARFMMANLLSGFLTRPHFIAYHYTDKGFALGVAKVLGAMSVMWTVKDQSAHDNLAKTEDGIIFEGYRPDTKFERGRKK